MPTLQIILLRYDPHQDLKLWKKSRPNLDSNPQPITTTIMTEAIAEIFAATNYSDVDVHNGRAGMNMEQFILGLGPPKS